MQHPENCLIDDLPAHQYRALPRVGGSGLRHLLRSAAHYRWHQDNPPKPTDATVLGEVLHQTLMPSASCRLVSDPPILLGNGRRDLKAMAERRAAWGPDCVPVSAEHAAIRQAVANAVSHNAEACRLLHGARFEQSFLWTDEATGLRCKGRADAITKDGVVVDLKTTSLSAEAISFERQVHQNGLALQAAHYLAFGLHAGAFVANRFVWLVVETTPPFGVRVFQIDHYSLAHAQDLRRRALALLASCQQSDAWPGYPQSEGPPKHLGLPGWALPYQLRLQRRLDETIEYAAGDIETDNAD